MVQIYSIEGNIGCGLVGSGQRERASETTGVAGDPTGVRYPEIIGRIRIQASDGEGLCSEGGHPGSGGATCWAVFQKGAVSSTHPV